MKGVCGAEGACRRPQPRRRIVQLRRCSRKHYRLLQPPTHCLTAPASPCDLNVRPPRGRSSPTTPSPDRTTPCCSRKNHYLLQPPAPCLRAAASPCERSVRCRGSLSPSTAPSPDRRAPRCSRNPHHPLLPPPAPGLRAAASPCETKRAVPSGAAVAVHSPVAGSYSSELLKIPRRSDPPATSTWPEGSSVAV